MNDTKDFPSALKEWREKQGLSQKAFGEQLGICQSAVYRYEHGKAKPSPETAARLVKLGFPSKLIQCGAHYNRTAKTALTDEERAFAEKHHKLVYSFLNSRRLREDDWYDIIIFGYLHAVQVWFKRKELHKYKFSVIAYSSMRDTVRQERKRARRHPHVISIYDVVHQSSDLTYADKLCDPRDCVGI